MNGPVVNVRNRCNRRCKCKGRRQLTTSVRTVKGIPGFGYCTHKTIKNVKISSATWKGIDLDRVDRGLHPFEGSTSITVYYYSRLDGKEGSINKPLLIRSKYDGDVIHWFENVGHYANKKWKRINGEAESKRYPKDDDYTDKNTEFGNKLNAIACRLFASHNIAINSDHGDKNRTCPICKQQVNVSVHPENSHGISGYTKYKYTGYITDKSILVYDKSPLTYRRQNRGFPGYYLPILLDEMISSVNVYYWDGDSNRKNPLLLELAGKNYISYWYENIGQLDGKHDKWKPIGYAESSSFSTNTNDLKKRLDSLNCIYNQAVQINIGKKEDCHETKHHLHKNRLYYSYAEVKDTYPVLYAYGYRSSEKSNKKPFNISEIYVKDQKQEFEDGLPFREVKRLTVYVSPCSSDKPFLICVEYYINDKTYKWYSRKKSESGIWEEYRNFYKGSSTVKNELGSLLEGASNDLAIGSCNIPTSADGIKLDITKTLGDEKSYITYHDDTNTKTKKVPIVVTKKEKHPTFGFFRNIHRANTGSKHFALDRQLQRGGKIGSGNKIDGVEKVCVYFWDGEPKIPILLRIMYTKNMDGKPEYYGKFDNKQGNTWMNSLISNMDEQEALDSQNCYVNKAIPIELTNPTDIKRFLPRNKSGCLKDKNVRSSGSHNFPYGANAYTIYSYNMPNGTKVSRVTYEKKDTNIPPYNSPISYFRIYKWNRSTLPLLVEFVKVKEESLWYENLNKDSLNWKQISKIEVDKFYDQNNPPTLTDNVTAKLDEVNCKVHGVVQLDISRTQKEHYCHNILGHVKRVQVTPQSQHPYSDFSGYEHSHVDPISTFTISSFYYGNYKREVTGKPLNFPIEDVKKVTVYFPNCNLFFPVAIHIKMGGGNEKWLKRIAGKDQWKEATDEFEQLKDSAEKIRNLLDEIRTETNACSQPQLKVPPPALPYFPIPNKAFTANNQELVTQAISNDKDDDLTFTSIFTPEVIVDEEAYEGFLNDEDEYEDIKEKQNEIILVKKPAGNMVGITFLPGDPQVMTISQPFDPSKIIIDISKDTEGGPGSSKTYIPECGKPIYLEKEEDPNKSGFHMFTHEFHEVPFKVDKVIFGTTTDIPDIIPSEEVTSYSVWYWKRSGMNNPLLVEIANSDGTYKYHYNKGGNDWVEHTRQPPISTSEPLEGELLEQTLDDLNCQLNKAVTMDLSKNVSENSENQRNGYCCNKHKAVKIISHLVTVNGKIMKYYKHSIEDDNFQLAAIKYYKDNMYNTPRKRIRSGNLKFPIKGPVDVYVFYCNKNPALIYVNGKQQNKWYKRRNSDYDNYWEDVSPTLKSITSSDLDSLRCPQQRELSKLLNTLECTLPICQDLPGTQPSISHITVDLANHSQKQPLVSVPPAKDQNINALDLGKFMGDLSGLLYNILKKGPELIGTSKPTTKETLPNSIDNFASVVKDVVNIVIPPAVTIDVWNRTRYPKNPNEYEPVVNVTTNLTDLPKGFTEYIHTLKGHEDKHFTLQKTKYKGAKTDIPHIQRVTQVSVFYWIYLETNRRGRPLLVNVVIQTPGRPEKIIFYENIGTGAHDNTNWKLDRTLPPTKIALQKKLQLLNCRLNSAVVIDVSQMPYPPIAGTSTYDACKEEDKKLDPQHGDSKMQVSKDPTDNKLGKYTVYTHELKDNSPGDKFHVVGFKNAGSTLTGIGSLPIIDVEELKVYMCEKGGSTPLLVYYKTVFDGFTGKNIYREWYKYENTDGISTWKQELKEAPSTEKDYECILKVLNSLPSNCKADSDSPEEPASEETVATTSSGDTTLPEGSPQPLIGTTVAAGAMTLGAISGISSGTLAGSAATFFAGWKLYNRYKGDPWVRQI